MKLEDMVNEQTSVILCYNIFPTGDKMDYFGQSIDKYGDGGHPL